MRQRHQEWRKRLQYSLEHSKIVWVLLNILFILLIPYQLVSDKLRRCPNCGRRWKMVHFNSPKVQFYRCNSCAMRFREFVQGQYQDASASNYDECFQQPITLKFLLQVVKERIDEIR